MQRPTRREILIATTSVGVGGALALILERRHAGLRATTGAASMQTPAPIAQATTLEALTEAEFLTLAAACERIYPQDDAPGALTLGVPIFIDRTLAAERLPAWADGLLTSAARLDVESFRRFAVPFAAASAANQDALIADWAAERDSDNARFVKHLVTATLEGVLSDPTHGGNRDRAGWRTFALGADPYAPSEVHRP
ncbi:MAG TPA: gluconate 2-dehydrogenase subunit 3 family protein [Polyangiaceae bacterium]